MRNERPVYRQEPLDMGADLPNWMQLYLGYEAEGSSKGWVVAKSLPPRKGDLVAWCGLEGDYWPQRVLRAARACANESPLPSPTCHTTVSALTWLTCALLVNMLTGTLEQPPAQAPSSMSSRHPLAHRGR